MTPSKTEIPVAPADPVETAKKEAITTYLSHWKEVEKRYADKASKAGDLKKYAAAVAQIQVEKDAENLHQRGMVTTGTITVGNPTAVSADIDRKVPKIVLSSCLDITKWQTIHTKTGKPAAMPSNRLLRYVIKATVEKWDKGWVVIEDKPQGKKC
ncbi:secreted protein/lipoprotein [Streptomyces sp. SBC-4]|nr:secreted protein/lipoprotein [Streptomyces sp. SBC-4]MDV5143251.1 secreted protein/lipoprotein [Streptomyces sp. SBC-4]